MTSLSRGGGGGCCPVTTTNLLWKSKRSFEKVYYKVWLTLLQSATALFITKCDGGVLQSATAILLQSVIEVITKCDRYYKVWLRLLQSATGITKCDGYYKVRQYIRCLALCRLIVWNMGVFDVSPHKVSWATFIAPKRLSTCRENVVVKLSTSTSMPCQFVSIWLCLCSSPPG